MRWLALVAAPICTLASSCGAPTGNLPSQPPGQAGSVELWSEVSETTPCPANATQCSGNVTFAVSSSGAYTINGTPEGVLTADELGNITQLADLVVAGNGLAGSYSCPGGANPNAATLANTRTLSISAAPSGTPVIVYQTDSSDNTCYRGTNGNAKNDAALEVYFDTLLNQYVTLLVI